MSHQYTDGTESEYLFECGDPDNHEGPCESYVCLMCGERHVAGSGSRLRCVEMNCGAFAVNMDEMLCAWHDERRPR